MTVWIRTGEVRWDGYGMMGYQWMDVSVVDVDEC